MRRSTFLYPVVNVAHILAMLVFFTAVAVMDLRLLGALRAVPWQRVIAVGRTVATAAFTAQALSGFLLFAADATALSANPAFLAKLAVIGLALVNVGLLTVLMRQRRRRGAGADPSLPAAAGACAALSLAAWLLTAGLGRLIAYV